MLLVRNQFGNDREGRWYPYSAQPDRNPWPGTLARTAFVLLRRDPSGTLSWHEFTLPEGTSIEAISAEGSTFRVLGGGVDVSTTGDELFRVIADSAFGSPGFSEAELARGFDKLAGRTPLDIVGPAEPGAILGSALPLVLDDPVVGTFTFRPERPAQYSRNQRVWTEPTPFSPARPGASRQRSRAPARSSPLSTRLSQPGRVSWWRLGLTSAKAKPHD